MNLYDDTAFVLRAGVVLGLAVTAVGLAMDMLSVSWGGTVLYAGILVLIASPFAGVLVTFVDLSRMGDRKWALTAAVLIMIVLAGLALAFVL